MAYRDPPTEDRAPVLVIPREEFSWWQRKKCAMGWHSLKACQFVILRQVRYGVPDLLRGYVLGTVHYDPELILCRCCGQTMNRSRFKDEELLALSTFEHALFSDDWENGRERPHPSTILLPGLRENWKDVLPRPKLYLG